MANEPMPPMPMPPRPDIMLPIPMEAICAWSAASCWGLMPIAPGACMPGFAAGRTALAGAAVAFEAVLAGAGTAAGVEFCAAVLLGVRVEKLGSGSAEGAPVGSVADGFTELGGAAAGAGS